jgi:hypothetical protein
MSYNCPNDHVEEAESGNQFASLGTELPEEEHSVVTERACADKVVTPGVALTSAHSLKWYEVLLDNQANISVVHLKLLTNIFKQKSYVSGLSGTAPLKYVGTLRDFFKCKGSSDLLASVLCMADVEDLYQITYTQGVSYTVHMDDGDLVFWKRDKLYVGDMREWASDYDESTAMVTAATDNEARYTSKEVKRAREARDMISNVGFSSETEALGLVNDGNPTGVQLTAPDIKRSFDIYGKTVYGVRGRRTAAHKAATQRVDRDLMSDYGEMQTMHGA